MTKEALTQLREVHAIQGRDGCWDIDDYMLGLYNGLELALSIVENRACKYKQRPKSQPEQEPVAWEQFYPDIGKPQIALNTEVVGYVAPQRIWVALTDEEREEIALEVPMDAVCITEAKLKEKNNV
jgi:hypothetical protein